MFPIEPADHAKSLVSSSGSADTSPASPSFNGSRKRLASGSRGIANLTPDQLAKKRANDREAQRAIRERTKLQIESLEREIRQLKSQKPYQDLQLVVQQKQAVEAEIVDLKRRLASVLHIIKPLVAGFEHGSYTSMITAIGLSAPRLICPTEDLGSPQYQDHHAKREDTAVPADYVNVPLTRAGANVYLPPPSSPAIWSVSSATISNSESVPVSLAPENTLDRQRALAMTLQAERSSYNPCVNQRQEIPDIRHLLAAHRGGPPLPADSHITLTASLDSPIRAANRGFCDGRVTLSARLPSNTSSSCPLDALLLDFLADRRQRSAEGMSNADLIGPAYPSFHCLFRPDLGRFTHDLSRFFTDILATFPDLKTPPEQVAVLYIMFLIMRWHISPNQANYDRLPDWVKPSTSQLHDPHPPWIDHLPWPRLRDKLISHYHRFPFDNFFIPFTTTLSLNWPYEPKDALVPIPNSEELSINPIFERHLRDLSNWSLGPAFAMALPELAETVRIRE
ncbi:hypothetical protein MMC26_000739 [Xylographa opegraphella]|nr:hypothetical protein [Xylographa opegraphella]